MTRNQFRLLTILSFAFAMGGGVWDLAFPLPPELEAYQASEVDSLDGLSLPALLVVLIVFLALAILSFVTLLVFHKSAPALFVATNVVAFAVSPFLGYGIYSPASELLFTLSTFCTGAMMAIIFMTDVRKFFGRQLKQGAIA